MSKLTMQIDFAVFNELSIVPLAADETEAVKWLLGVVNVMKRATRLRIHRLRTRHDFRQSRISAKLTVEQAVSRLDRDGRTLVYSILQSPYLDEPYHDDYLSCDLVSLLGKPCNSAEGLLCAEIMGALAVSFANGIRWDTEEVEIGFRQDGVMNPKAVIPHASHEDHLASRISWAARRTCSPKELVPTADQPLPNTAFSDQLVTNWPQFYRDTAKLPPIEKTAKLREIAMEVARANGYDHSPALSAKNAKASGSLRQIFVSAFTLAGHEYYLSTDFEKAAGAFEYCDRNGRHLGEWLFSGKKNASADPSGRHDIIVA